MKIPISNMKHQFKSTLVFIFNLTKLLHDQVNVNLQLFTKKKNQLEKKNSPTSLPPTTIRSLF